MCITVFAYNGGYHIGYTIKSLHRPGIIHDARPIIVNSQLMLIFMWWYQYRLHYWCRETQPIQSLYDDFEV